MTLGLRPNRIITSEKKGHSNYQLEVHGILFHHDYEHCSHLNLPNRKPTFKLPA
jgi:hypothetical protein